MTAETDPTRILAEEVAVLRRELADTRYDLTETRAELGKLINTVLAHDHTFIDMNNSLGAYGKSLEATQGWLSRVVSGTEDGEENG